MLKIFRLRFPPRLAPALLERRAWRRARRVEVDMSARASLPALAENAVTALFERAINDTRIFWAQRADGSLFCAEWEWCCPEIPAVLAGLEAVVFVTREASSVRVVSPEVVVVMVSAERVWGRHRVLRRAPKSMKALTWDDRVEVRI